MCAARAYRIKPSGVLTMAERGEPRLQFKLTITRGLLFFAEAYVSLATNNQYVYGAVALGRSLRNTGTQRRLALMITEQVTEDMR